jgi:hypothetical protein
LVVTVDVAAGGKMVELAAMAIPHQPHQAKDQTAVLQAVVLFLMVALEVGEVI